ncbi:hypothetical protein MTO96_045947 [Rhipicephalus appendiculatus]
MATALYELREREGGLEHGAARRVRMLPLRLAGHLSEAGSSGTAGKGSLSAEWLAVAITSGALMRGRSETAVPPRSFSEAHAIG